MMKYEVNRKSETFEVVSGLEIVVLEEGRFLKSRLNTAQHDDADL